MVGTEVRLGITDVRLGINVDGTEGGEQSTLGSSSILVVPISELMFALS
jgi:hypothetical protein